MRTYWIETLLIAALFTMAMGFTLAHADGNAVPEYVYGDKTGVVPDSVYGNNGNQGNQSNLNIAVTPHGTTISVQPLDAPTNPYLKQYTDIDRYIYSNMDADYTRTTLTQQSSQPGVIGRSLFNNPTGGDRRVPVLVDENGYMIPTTSPRYLTPQFVQTAPGEYTVADADLYDNILGDAPADPGAKVTPGTAANDKVKVAVKGETRIRPSLAYSYTMPLTEEKYEQFRKLQIEAAASTLPKIPSWIDNLHPKTVSLLPNGAVLVPSQDATGVTTYTVYGSNGTVLGTAKAMEWHKYFATNYDSIMADAKAKGYDVAERSGYTVLRNHATGKVEAVFDWDGKPVEITSGLQPRPYYFTPLVWESVAPVAVQQRMVPAVGRDPEAQQTVGTEHQSDNSPAPDTK